MILRMEFHRNRNKVKGGLNFGSGCTRRDFLRGAAMSATSLALGARGLCSQSAATQSPARGTDHNPLRGRFLTHISVVRVNQIEVTPARSIGQDEASDNRPELIRARRDAFSRGCPDGKMTWAISWLALNDSRNEYREARRLLASYHDRYGDEVTFIPGGYFAPMYDTREHIRETIHQALGKVSEMVGGGYRPQCLIAGFMDAENQRLLARMKAFTCARGRSGASTGLITEMAMGEFAIPTTRAGSIT
jgi:hypothetical protein